MTGTGIWMHPLPSQRQTHVGPLLRSEGDAFYFLSGRAEEACLDTAVCLRALNWQSATGPAWWCVHVPAPVSVCVWEVKIAPYSFMGLFMGRRLHGSTATATLKFIIIFTWGIPYFNFVLNPENHESFPQYQDQLILEVDPKLCSFPWPEIALGLMAG